MLKLPEIRTDLATEAKLQRGYAALNAGEYARAAGICQQILQKHPRLIQAHYLIGLVALGLKDRRNAIEAFGSITKLQPTHGAAWAYLARLFVEIQQPLKVSEALSNAQKYAGRDAKVNDLLGATYSLMGDQKSAQDFYSKAVLYDPKNISYRMNLASALTALGDTGGAQVELAKVVSKKPLTARAHWQISGLRKAEDTGHIDQMISILDQTEGDDDLAFLHFAIGKELEDLNQWDRAFAAFASGGRAKRRTLKYDEAAEISTFNTLVETYTEDWMASGSASSVDAVGPIFVLGQPRSGTTLVERIITSHSQVTSAGELQEFALSIRRLLGKSYPGRLPAQMMLDAAALSADELGATYLEATKTFHPNTDYFVDKLPTNYLYIPLIMKALPNAKVILLKREPMDSCFSSYKQLFAEAYPHSYDQGEMARHYLRYANLTQIWQQRFGARFLTVGYEDVVGNLEANARRLINFLELPWQDACLNFHEQEGAVMTASAVQVREPVHAKSVGRWQRYEKHLYPMRTILEKLPKNSY